MSERERDRDEREKEGEKEREGGFGGVLGLCSSKKEKNVYVI